MEIYSIGFTQKSASQFFETLKAHGIERLLDVRLNNTSQLAGFAKQADLAYFLKAICGALYEHEPLLAPTQDILDAFKKKKGDWDVYTDAYLSLIRSRKVESARIAGIPWRKIRRFDEQRDLETLKSAVSPEPVVLQGCSDRIDTHKFETTAARVSLSLLEPEDLWWWIREELGKRKYRANFRLGHEGRIRYDLPVTDPAWLDQLNLVPTGIHPHSILCAKRHTHTFLTASLSEPFEGFHYKLIAGVINLPA